MEAWTPWRELPAENTAYGRASSRLLEEPVKLEPRARGGTRMWDQRALGRSCRVSQARWCSAFVLTATRGRGSWRASCHLWPFECNETRSMRSSCFNCISSSNLDHNPGEGNDVSILDMRQCPKRDRLGDLRDVGLGLRSIHLPPIISCYLL